MRNRLIKKAIRRRFVVTLPGNEGAFSGIMVDSDTTYWIFEDCRSVPRRQGETVEEWPGRIWIKHASSPPPYLQEITVFAEQLLQQNM